MYCLKRTIIIVIRYNSEIIIANRMVDVDDTYNIYLLTFVDKTYLYIIYHVPVNRFQSHT